MRKLEMTSYERVMAAIRGKEYDVSPAISPTSVATIDSMKKTGAFFPDAHINWLRMTELAAAGHELLGFDSVMPYFSVHLEAKALGCEIDWGSEHQVPRVVKKVITKVEHYEIPAAVLSKPELQSLLKAVKALKKKYSRKVAIIGKVIGPWTLAYNLYGVENLVLDTILEPKRTARLIEMLSEVPIAFAKAQFEAGVDMITWAEHVTSDLISTQIYADFVLPIHRRASFELTKLGPVILHICGNVMDRLDVIKQTGFPIFHLDSRNDIEKTCSVLGDRMMLTGGINNPVTLAQGTRQDVKKEVRNILRKKIDLISPECALPCNVANDNLIALTEELHCQRRSEFLV